MPAMLGNKFMPTPAHWAHHRSVAIYLNGVPEKATTWHIWNAFSACGNIVFIEIFADQSDRRRGRASVRFSPPPKQMNWPGGRCALDVDGRRVPISVEQQPMRDEQWIETPLGNRVPQCLEVAMAKIGFGVLVGPERLMVMKDLGATGSRTVLERQAPEGLKLSVNFRYRSVTAFFPVDMGVNLRFTSQFKMEVRFEQIKDFFHVQRLENNGFALVLALDHPAAYYRKKVNSNAAHFEQELRWTESELWARAVDITDDATSKRNQAERLNKEGDIINLGRWTAYWFEMDQASLKTWQRVEQFLRDFNIHTKTTEAFERVPAARSELWDSLEPVSSGRGDTSALSLLADETRIHLPFDVTYQLQVCLSHGWLSDYNLDIAFLRKLLELTDPESYDPDRARLMLEYVADKAHRIFEPMAIFEDPAAKTYFPPHVTVPAHCVLMRKATVTPTTIYFASPTIETTNRVIRQYWSHRDRFLRVQFTDEIPKGKIFSGPDSTRDNHMFTRVHRVLFQGIQIGDRRYEFLAFGSSQIREAGAYFFAPTAEITCDTIRSWMGMDNMGHIKTVAKLAARLGQCFSTTRAVYGVRHPQVKEIEDIERNNYCFTDGVGKISTFLAESIRHDWGLNEMPSVFQFRMGGCKGILAVAPELKGPTVHIRPSQKKFDASQKGLEIIKCSQFSTASLNRQTIVLLSNLGVPNEPFLDMLKTQLNDYNEAMQDSRKAVKLLSQFVDENQMTLEVARHINDGFMDCKEPFIMTLLHLWRSWSMKMLKDKAKIIVADGAYVLGCVDETGTLRGHVEPSPTAQPGTQTTTKPPLPQIFIQVPDPEKRHAYRVITGLCLVGRNPSLHPGDLRVVEAVDVPALHHMRDVVVFPQLGDRDLPSMMSGGDLDGDDFFVFWDQRLIPPESQRNYPPMEFRAPPPLAQNRRITADDLRTFFVLHMKNDTLPTIAHAHMAWADYMTPLHSKDPKCLELTELHSRAVDYVKSGEPAIMPKKLQPTTWPHFMEKNGKSYRSHEVLGKLYDQTEHVEFRPGYDMPFDQRILSRFSGAEDALPAEMLEKARKIKAQYDVALRRIMGQLEIRTEFEVWSTFVLSRPRVGSGYKLQEHLGHQSHSLKQHFRGVCEEAAGGREFEVLAPFIVAMYRATWEEVQARKNEAPLISFPWLYGHLLGRIASSGRSGESAGAVSGLVDLPAGPTAGAKAGAKAVEARKAAEEEEEGEEEEEEEEGEVECMSREDGACLVEEDDDDGEDEVQYEDVAPFQTASDTLSVRVAQFGLA